MKHTIKLLTLVATLVAVIGLTGCPHPVNDNSDTHEHIWEETITKNPTCTEKGEKKLVCKICGVVETEEIAKLPHSWVEDENDNCHYVCHNCGATKVEHTFVCGGCDKCGTYEFDGEDDYQLEIEIYNKVSYDLKTCNDWFDNKNKVDTVYFSFNKDNLSNYEKEIKIGTEGVEFVNDFGENIIIKKLSVEVSLKDLILLKRSYNISNQHIKLEKGHNLFQVLVE